MSGAAQLRRGGTRATAGVTHVNVRKAGKGRQSQAKSGEVRRSVRGTQQPSPPTTRPPRSIMSGPWHEGVAGRDGKESVHRKRATFERVHAGGRRAEGVREGGRGGREEPLGDRGRAGCGARAWGLFCSSVIRTNCSACHRAHARALVSSVSHGSVGATRQARRGPGARARGV